MAKAPCGQTKKKLLWCKKVNKQYLFLRQHTFLTNELVTILKEKIWVTFRKSYLKKSPFITLFVGIIRCLISLSYIVLKGATLLG